MASRINIGPEDGPYIAINENNGDIELEDNTGAVVAKWDDGQSQWDFVENDISGVGAFDSESVNTEDNVAKVNNRVVYAAHEDFEDLQAAYDFAISNGFRSIYVPRDPLNPGGVETDSDFGGEMAFIGAGHGSRSSRLGGDSVFNAPVRVIGVECNNDWKIESDGCTLQSVRLNEEIIVNGDSNTIQCYFDAGIPGDIIVNGDNNFVIAVNVDVSDNGDNNEVITA